MEKLHEHNQKTYENICYMYSEGIQRVAVVQPTGSGKSLLMAKLIEDNPNSRFFVLSTSHKINDQFKSKLDDEMLKRIDFNIYCNMPNMNEDIMKALQPDYILLDEMHRALAKEWSKGINVLLEMYPDAKVLGLSATPIRYLDRCRNVVEELFNGNLACDMSLSQAILDGVLPMARYVCGVYSFEKDAESLNKKIAKSCNSDEEKKELLRELKVLKENLDKGHGVSDIFRKYIVSGSEKFVVFLKNTKHLGIMKPVIEKWFTDAGFNVHMYEVHSKNVDRDKEFQAFKEDKEDGIIKACLSVNMIAEGIHGDIDGVIMLRETISPNMYFQMIGRAFSCGKKTIPLIFDLVANSEFISDAVDNFPNELKTEIEKRKEECEKEGKDYEVGFDVDEFIIMDEFMDAISGFRAIEERLHRSVWTEEENEILKKYYLVEKSKVANRLKGRTKVAVKNQAKRLGLTVPKTGRKWTKEENELLKEYYPIEGYKVMKRLKGRTKKAVQEQASKLELNIYNSYIYNSWTEEENKILKEYYLVEGSKVADRLEGRTRRAIQMQARKLGLNIYNSWTEEENKILKEYYLVEGSKVADRLEGRTRRAIQMQANKLGLKMKNKPWTKEEIEILKQYYPIEGIRVMDRLNERTEWAVQTQIKKLGLSIYNGKTWTEEENNILREYYSLEGSKVADRLEGRTKAAIMEQARRLGITRNYKDIYWTDEEIDILKQYYPIEGVKVKDRLCGRTKCAIATQAIKLGLERRKDKKYKYVYNEKNRYVVSFEVDGKRLRFGTYDSEDEALKVAMEKAKEYGKAI